MITLAILASLTAAGFIISVYSWGNLTRWLIELLSKSKVSFPFGNAVLNVYLGLTTYSLVMLGLGTGGLLTPLAVIIASLAPLPLWLLWERRPITLPSIAPLGGATLFAAASGLFFFQPVLSFDGLWYHLTIPKLFFQTHGTAELGPLIRYSLQPNLDFFWNLWPQAVIPNLAEASVAANLMQLAIMALGLYAAARAGEVLFGWKKAVTFMAPVLLGVNNATISLFGTVYTDHIGLVVGLVAALYAYYLVCKKHVTWAEFITALVLMAGLALIKIFFLFFSLILAGYLMNGVWAQLPGTDRQKQKNILLIIVTIGLVLGLPWIARSYHYSGRLLDPLGSSEFVEQAYKEEGSLYASSHWTSYVYSRFEKNLWSLLTFSFTPLVLVALIAIAAFRRDTKLRELWLAAFAGMGLIYFMSVFTVPRYLLPAVAVAAFLGLVFLERLSRLQSIFSKVVIWFPFVVFTWSVLYGGWSNYRHSLGSFITTNQTASEFVVNRQVGNIFDYHLTANNVPSDLKKTEPVLVEGVHNLYYFPNPILSPAVQTKAFKAAGFNAQTDLVRFASQHHVRYVLIKGKQDAKTICQEAFVEKADDCRHEGGGWSIVARDKAQNAIWLKLEQ